MDNKEVLVTMRVMLTFAEYDAVKHAAIDAHETLTAWLSRTVREAINKQPNSGN
jgi:hypothetical protein